ncbi:hypothetical protein O181_045467 [Austropuccinia psidii MF-1]|uniref:Uncharacterized protein n=1 Tax=Austropuccinia psidii MF-1 TaxID=1389203 RepID=A0A9Q3HIR9_9BASI|nr:hypothetical protein [Austropuccinia psidii MF-1]
MPELKLFTVTTTSLTLLLDGCGNPTWSQVGANWSRHIFYGQLAPFGVPWRPHHNTLQLPFYGLRPYPAIIGPLWCSMAPTSQHSPIAILWPQAISCHHWPFWPFPTSTTPRPSSLILGPGGPFCFLGASSPP